MVKFRQLIKKGQQGRDVKAVKSTMKRIKILGHAKMGDNGVAGQAFVDCIKNVQKRHQLRVDGIYGPSTHKIIAPHFSLFNDWQYRTARIRKTKTHTNPFPDGWIPNRLDMGFDGTFRGYIVAPFDGVITHTENYNSSWRGGVVQLKADKKPKSLPTDTLYFAEGLAPLVKTGQHVKMGQHIAKEAPSGWGDAYGTTPDGRGQIEWGVAAPGVDGEYVNTYAIDLGLGSPQARGMVLNFARWAEGLGLKPPTQTSNAGNA